VISHTDNKKLMELFIDVTIEQVKMMSWLKELYFLFKFWSFRIIDVRNQKQANLNNYSAKETYNNP
jgi:hypothetical protein